MRHRFQTLGNAGVKAPDRAANLILLLLLLVFPAAAAEPQDIGVHLKAATEHLQNNDLPAAEQELRSVLAINDQQPAALTLLGLIHDRGGQIDEAIRYHLQALAADPNFTAARKNLATSYYRQGNRDLAVAELQKVLALDSNDGTALYNLARILMEQGHAEAALTHLEKLLEIHPEDANAHLILSRLYLMLGRKAEAETVLAQLAEKDPKDAALLFRAGSLLVSSQHRLDLAIDYLRQALELSPYHPAILLELAEAYRLRGDSERCLSSIDQFIDALRVSKARQAMGPLMERARRIATAAREKAGSSFRTDFLLAEILFISHEYSGAIELLKNRSAEGAEDPDYFNLLAMSHTGLNNFQDAGKALTQAIRLAPERTDLLFNLATLYQKAGDNAAAVEILRKLASREPESAEIRFALGLANFNFSKYDDAVEDFQKVLSLDPGLVQAQLFVARSHDKGGRPSEAIEAYRGALAANPKCEECHFELASLLTERDADEAAVRQLEELVALNPRHAQAHYLWGRILAKQEKTADAVSKLERAIALDPELDAAYYQLGRLYTKTGNQDRARELLRKVSEMKEKRRKDYQERVSGPQPATPLP